MVAWEGDRIVTARQAGGTHARAVGFVADPARHDDDDADCGCRVALRACGRVGRYVSRPAPLRRPRRTTAAAAAAAEKRKARGIFFFLFGSRRRAHEGWSEGRGHAVAHGAGAWRRASRGAWFGWVLVWADQLQAAAEEASVSVATGRGVAWRACVRPVASHGQRATLSFGD